MVKEDKNSKLSAGAECYHPTGSAGAGYIAPNGASVAGPAQNAMRLQPGISQQQNPPTQQDMIKTNMPGHNYVHPQSQTGPRQQYPNYPYRPSQHNPRPSTHSRQQQQQQYIPNASGPGTSIVYPAIVYPPHLYNQQYSQPRNSQGYPPLYVPQYYATPAAPHATQYYYSASNQQMSAPNMQATNPGGVRNNQTTLITPQGSSATGTQPIASIPHQAPVPMHQGIPASRPIKHSKRLAIINPVTQKDIFSELNANEQPSGEINENNQPQSQEQSIAEVFSRMVNEAVNAPSPSENKENHSIEIDTLAPVNSSHQNTQISSSNVKSDIINIIENNKAQGSDQAVESTDTPVVSAMSDSPVIVPKIPNNKQIQSNILTLESNKTFISNKQNKTKPFVPTEDEDENVNNIVVADLPADQSDIPDKCTLPNEQTSKTTAEIVEPIIELNYSQSPVPIEATQLMKNEDNIFIHNKTSNKEPSQENESSPILTESNGPVPEFISTVETNNSLPRQSYSENNSVEEQILSNTDEVFPEENAENTTNSVIATEPVSNIAESSEEPETVKKLPEILIVNKAQEKLSQGIKSCIQTDCLSAKMKDINLNSKHTDPDTDNEKSEEVPKIGIDDNISKNEDVAKNLKKANMKSPMISNENNDKTPHSHENGKDEIDKSNYTEQDELIVHTEDISKEDSKDSISTPSSVPAITLKYKYSEGQWSPLNLSGKKVYSIEFLMQLKDAPLCKIKPNIPMLETLHIARTSPMPEMLSFPPMSRSMNDTIMPSFLKGNSTPSSRNNTLRDGKKDGRTMSQMGGRGSTKLMSSGSGNSGHKPMIHVSLSLKEDIKLNETENAWKPARLQKLDLDAEELKTQEIYKKFRGILNKLTPENFDKLMDRVKDLKINTQKRLEGVIDLVFEKAIEEPNFSEAYAAMCNKLSVIKVPVDNPQNPEHNVNFRGLIISRCQKQFMTDEVDEAITKLQNELSQCTDPNKRKELQVQLEEQNRRVRMRSVGNVRFIGELYKLKMLTSKIMLFCMDSLLEKLEEEKLECLCKLVTTIGEQVESELKEQLDSVFKKMQEITDRRDKISSRVRFMILDVIALRKRKWVRKSVVDQQPKMMDQIQKEAEHEQRHIELMNATTSYRGSREDGNRDRGRRGDGRRQNSNSYMDNQWKTASSRPSNFTVDTSKFKAVSQTTKNISNVKLMPQHSVWTKGSGAAKSTSQATSNSISLSKNKFSPLDNLQSDSPLTRGNKDVLMPFSKGASIERSSFSTQADLPSDNQSRSGSVSTPRSNPSNQNSSTLGTPNTPTTPSSVNETTPSPQISIIQEPLPEEKRKSVNSTIDFYILNADDAELVTDVKHHFQPQYHASVVTELVNIALEKSQNKMKYFSNALTHLIMSNTISPENFILGITEILELAPDLFIDIPKVYEYLGLFITPMIQKKVITFKQVLDICASIISANHGHLLLESILKNLKESMGPSFVKSKWQESELQLKDWMAEDEIPKWIEANKFEFLEGETNSGEEMKKKLTNSETHKKLLELMNSDESCVCIVGWVQDNIGKDSNQDWFMRTLIQAICEFALSGSEHVQFSREKMNKYSSLILEFGENKEAREASCLFGIQQLVHRLEHPQGLTLDIFQYFYEQYIISVDGFIVWENSEKEPEGKAVMKVALTSFFTNIKEGENDDTGSED